jgi:ribonuclease HII
LLLWEFQLIIDAVSSCTLDLENSLRAKGKSRVAGVDEAGRGPLAGPVYAAAVFLPIDFSHPFLNDSKKLSVARRESIYEELVENADVIISSARASVKEIETLNILQATHLAMKRAVLALVDAPDIALIDGLKVRGFPFPQQAVVGGDGLSLSIAAASIVAKVERDRYMIAQSKKFPEYGFEKHKGYGTRQHMEALRSHGPCPLHRKTFAPIAQLVFDFAD